ncbi:MAG: hypothetical protein AAGU19_13615 [Prolixibacteraceae bacterium]
MTRTFKHRIRRLPAFICMAVVAMLALNDIVFLHAHELPNGQVVIHAHPYSKGADAAPLKKHHHSTTEYIAIDQAQLLFPFSFFTLSAVFLYCFSRPAFPIQREVLSLYLRQMPGRSPPIQPEILMNIFAFIG